MRARAQKKKKAPSEAEETQPREAEETRPRQPDDDAEPPSAELLAIDPPAVAPPPVNLLAAEPPADTSDRRAIPDPQGPPVVAPVLMPAVMLADREDARAATVGAVEADSGAIAPVAEMLMPAASAATRLSITPQGYALTPGGHEGARPTALTSPTVSQSSLASLADDGDAAEDEAWRAGDEARLLVQSPRRLFLYWRFARDPRELLREALGPVADRFSPAVRLVDMATDEEGEPAPAEGSDYWFDVLPGRLLRADVGFHGEGLPFVRLISSNTVETPAAGVSRVADEAPEFRAAEHEFGRVLEATGFAAEERHEDPARRGGDPTRPPDADVIDGPTSSGEPPRASSDTARPASSPRDGGHFSNTRGGGEMF